MPCLRNRYNLKVTKNAAAEPTKFGVFLLIPEYAVIKSLSRQIAPLKAHIKPIIAT